jgi:hypothetical protein
MAGIIAPLGLAFSVASTIASGMAAKSAASSAAVQQGYIATEDRQAAGQAIAVSDQRAIQDTKQAQLLEGRASAVAGASGVEVTSPQVTNTVGNIAARGSYNALSDLYTGNERANAYLTGANLANYQAGQDYQAGAQKIDASLFSTAGTIAGSSATKTLLENFGQGGPPPLTGGTDDMLMMGL